MNFLTVALLTAAPIAVPPQAQDAQPLPRSIHWSDVDGDRLPDALLVSHDGRAVLALNRGRGAILCTIKMF